ncbi:MAG: hypothetical protein BRC57_08810 [Cyanobacteria bacterium QS_8_48_54]|jgi:uncharacterized membrane protein YbhN (UPF0104 family)|nr:MAG: hypothetical protein BRC57_08810 [Cyanobacteria bacterium QS_8_48_54]
MVPGGLGLFEKVIFLLLAPHAPADTVLGKLLVYRGLYYFLPLTTAVLLLGVHELRRYLT